MVEIEPAYDKIFTNVPLEEDILYAIGYNWFAQLVALTQKMAYVKKDFTPMQILEALEKVGYFPHIVIEEPFTKTDVIFNTEVKKINEDIIISTQKPASAGNIIETYPKTSIKLQTSLSNWKEEVEAYYVVRQNIISLNDQDYNHNRISFDENNNMTLSTQWRYQGKESTIDSGHLFIITTQTSDLADVQAVIIHD